jgi:hypothetical protein
VDEPEPVLSKTEAWRVAANEDVPRGVRCALSLHDRYGTRLLGFDNAHAVNPTRRQRYMDRGLTYIIVTGLLTTRAYPANSPARSNYATIFQRRRWVF